MSFIDNNKSDIRKNLLQARQNFDEYLYDEKNTAISNNVLQTIKSLSTPSSNAKGYHHGKPNVGIYWPLKGEPDLLKLALLIDNVIGLPKLVKEEIIYALYHLGDFIEKSNNAFIYQPAGNTEIDPGIMIIPGLAFSLKGYRLGFGKGHYDKYLSKIRKVYHPITIGVCFHDKLFESLPAESHDEKLDYIITDEVIIKI